MDIAALQCETNSSTNPAVAEILSRESEERNVGRKIKPSVISLSGLNHASCAHIKTSRITIRYGLHYLIAHRGRHVVPAGLDVAGLKANFAL